MVLLCLSTVLWRSGFGGAEIKTMHSGLQHKKKANGRLFFPVAFPLA
jgi:hypothetical protein